jgi:eukaryotic-like serine/threonine-protein kinase
MRPLDERRVQHLREVVDLPDLGATRYEMVRRVAQGGMGTVYAVRDRELDREVALKVLSLPDPAGELAARLQSEARLLARLEHPNIVPVHDVGTLPDGRVFYVMTLVRGRRLDAWRTDGPTLPAMLRLFQSVCGAVAFAHAHGVVHRDLKPDNIMVGPFGQALVMDWGVAKILDAARESAPTLAPGEARAPGVPGPAGEPATPATLPGALIGTPSWMSPEQARGDHAALDARTDVHALGAILYFLLAGRPPFTGDSPAAILERVREHRIEPPGRFAPGLPRALTSICARAMAREREDRYAGALELGDDVERYLDGLPVSAHRETLVERGQRLVKRHAALVVLVAAYLVMRVLVLALAGR